MTGLFADVLLGLLAASLAFAIGFAIRRGSICAVAVTQLWVVRGYTMRMRAFAVAAAASGAIILPLTWTLPEHANLSLTYPVDLTTFGAAALFAAGARLNMACGFGTLSHLSGGRLEYLGAVFGMVLGAMIAQGLRGEVPPPGISPLSIFTWPTASLWAVMVLFALPSLKARHWRNLKSAIGPGNTMLRPFTAMLLIGSLGGALYALAGSWTYLSLIEKQAVSVGNATTPETISITATIGAVSMLIGAVYAAWRSGKFKMRKKPISVWVRHLVAGLCMGGAAALIPGGNGALIVFGVPSGAMNTIIALLVIKAFLALSFWPDRLSHRWTGAAKQ